MSHLRRRVCPVTSDTESDQNHFTSSDLTWLDAADRSDGNQLLAGAMVRFDTRQGPILEDSHQFTETIIQLDDLAFAALPSGNEYTAVDAFWSRTKDHRYPVFILFARDLQTADAVQERGMRARAILIVVQSRSVVTSALQQRMWHLLKQRLETNQQTIQTDWSFLIHSDPFSCDIPIKEDPWEALLFLAVQLPKGALLSLWRHLRLSHNLIVYASVPPLGASEIGSRALYALLEGSQNLLAPVHLGHVGVWRLDQLKSALDAKILPGHVACTSERLLIEKNVSLPWHVIITVGERMKISELTPLKREQRSRKCGCMFCFDKIYQIWTFFQDHYVWNQFLKRVQWTAQSVPNDPHEQHRLQHALRLWFLERNQQLDEQLQKPGLFRKWGFGKRDWYRLQKGLKQWHESESTPLL